LQQLAFEQTAKHEKSAEENLKNALVLSGQARDDRNLVDNLLVLIDFWISHKKVDQAFTFLPVVQAMVARVGREPYIQTLYAKTYAKAYVQRGELPQAQEFYAQALSAAIRLYGAEHWSVIEYHQRLGEIYLEQGNFSSSKEQFVKAVELVEKNWGKQHPKLALPMYWLGRAWAGTGQAETAIAHYRSSLQMLSPTADNRELFQADVYDSMGLALLAHHELNNAEKTLHQAVELRKQQLGVGHALTALSLRHWAQALVEQKKFQQALAAYKQVLQVQNKALGAKNKQSMATLGKIAQVLAAMERTDEAETSYKEALSGTEEVLGKNDPHVARLRLGLAQLQLQSKQYPNALRNFESCYSIYGQKKEPSKERAHCAWGIAQSLQQAKKDPERQRKLAHLAQVDFEKLGDTSEASKIRDWLTKH
jgi:tetratricopeptide (TPR) repeat protein